MKNQKRLRDYGIHIGKLKCGNFNSITDVKGIKVGHCTIDNDRAKTGVTAIMPSSGNIFKEKLMASYYAINGFGKTTGTVQIEELGTLETPIILTNTLSVGAAEDALIEYMLQGNEDIGLTTGTVNPIVCECNDGYLNCIREGFVKKEHVMEAISNADIEFEEGSVGAGTGMSCFDLKGGIGSASRVIQLDNQEYTVGALVLSNFGEIDDFIIDGIKVGKLIQDFDKEEFKKEEEKGSIIVIIATDVPCSERQLKRIAKRAAIGISRTGGYAGNGSGEIAIAFSTANRILHNKVNDISSYKMIHDESINLVFRATVESVEEAILNSMVCASTTKGRDSHTRYSLEDYLDNQNILDRILNASKHK